MKRTSIAVALMLAVIIGGHGIAGAATGVHTDYRTGYTAGCGGTNSAACHTINQGTFLPGPLDKLSPAPNEDDYTAFCLTCHNASGEAHNKSAGSPSKNTYINSTGLIPGNAGTSHSWNGLNHNAGTRTPTSAGFIKTVDGSDFMPGGKVRCQTCHNAMLKTAAENIEPPTWVESINQGGNDYTFGYSSTKQYLAKYIKVYRSSVAMTKPTNTRTKNQLLVDPSEYTYNYLDGTITFNTSQGTNVIYVEIPQPYLRVDNTANAMCLDCHNDRSDQNQWVSHEPGTGEKDNHPVAVNYGYGFGLHSTLKPAATGNAYIENVLGNGQVLCTTCHDPHNAASNNGMILREADGSALCGDCHKTILDGYSTAGSVNMHNGSKHLAPTMCLDCHGTHNSNNIMLIRNVINGKAINFRNFSGPDSFGNENGTSICEVCHTATTHHRASNDTGLGHEAGNNCLECHKHETGFKYSGGGTSGCGSCHPYPGSGNEWPAGNGHLVRYDSVTNTHLPATGYDYQNPNEYTDMVADPTRCGKCHPNNPANHNGLSGGNGTLNVAGNGNPACGGGNFVINVVSSLSIVNCQNAKCHTANKTTPNWWEP